MEKEAYEKTKTQEKEDENESSLSYLDSTHRSSNASLIPSRRYPCELNKALPISLWTLKFHEVAEMKFFPVSRSSQKKLMPLVYKNQVMIDAKVNP